MSFHVAKTYRVGIDLAPAARGSQAPGTARFVAEQAKALFKLDVPWTWVPFVEETANPLYAASAKFNPIVVTGRKFWTRATLDIGRALKSNRCDVGFATAYFVPWHSCKVVANFFDSNIYEYGWTWVDTGRRWNYYLNWNLSTYCLWKARRLFVISEYCAEVLRKKFPAVAPKIQVISPGIADPLPKEVAVRPAALGELQKHYGLYVGVFSENKNQRRLIEAWAKWQQATPDTPTLVLVGHRNDDYYRNKILPERARAPRPDEIILIDFLTNEELSWTYRNASLYLQPSFAEGFGMPIIEAMGYGLPVATSNTTSLPEVGGDAAAYFDPASVDSMLQTIREVWADENRRKIMIERGSLRRLNYTWEKNAQAVALQIESVLAS